MAESKMYSHPKLPEYLLKLCRDFRKDPTDAEKILWESLRNRRLNGIRFRRQVPIDRYVIDFLSYESKLAVELDGDIHEQQREYDELRDGELESRGLRVLRFPNVRVFNDLENVLEEISDACQHLPSPLGRGAGGEG